MFFRNLRLLRLDPQAADLQVTRDLASKLEAAGFTECTQAQMRSTGFIPPRGNPGEYVVNLNGHNLIALGVEQRLLPASVIRQYTQTRLAELEQAQGYKPGRGQTREVREQITAELIPRAFRQRAITYAWIDGAGGWFVIDASSPARADEVIECLGRALDSVPLMPLRTAWSPVAAMTEWLAAGDAPSPFTIDRECELRSVTEERAQVRYARHNLDVDRIRPDLAEGKRATRLALTWNDRISFVLTEDGTLKRLAFLDLLKEQAEKDAADNGDIFEADFAIMSSELSRMLADLVDALGGHAEV